MGFSKRAKVGWAGLALFAAIAGPAVMSGGSASLVGDPELSSAEIVSLRFPSDAEELVQAARAESSTAREAEQAEQEVLAILAFNPDPLGIPGPRTSWAAPQTGEAAPEAADPAQAAPVERTGSVSAVPQVRAAQPARPKRQPATLFNDAQIASIKDRLRLSRDQEQYWPRVEAALRYIGWRHSRQRSASQVPALDPDDVERVKAAAVPLIMTLREDQKREVRMLAHVMGLEKIAAQF